MFQLPATIRRRFADIDIGQMHYYTAGEGQSERPPVCLMGPSPWSAKWLAPLVADLGETRWAIAPDTLGQGDSCPPPEGAEIPVPTVLTLAAADTAETDMADVAARIPDCVVRPTPSDSRSGDLEPLTNVILEFLDAT